MYYKLKYKYLRVSTRDDDESGGDERESEGKGVDRLPPTSRGSSSNTSRLVIAEAEDESYEVSP